MNISFHLEDIVRLESREGALAFVGLSLEIRTWNCVVILSLESFITS